MNAWSNIEISSQDSEIAKIDKLEKTLGQIPVHVKQIRELITRFEVCHFKFKQHFKKTKESIMSLQPTIIPNHIGTNHLHKDKDAWKNDKTGRSFLGQQYLCALNSWLGDGSQNNTLDKNEMEREQQVTKWLGYKTPEKERLVRLLIARLTWNWKLYNELQNGGELELLEQQACRMDICHYAFPKNLEDLLQSIGKLKPVKEFEGCGTYNSNIKTYLSAEFSKLCNWLRANISTNNIKLDKNEEIQVWLIACLAKTLKEQLDLKKTIPVDY